MFWKLRRLSERFFEKHLGGHITIKIRHWRITIYGHNAMHFAVNIATYRWGYICFHPPVRMYGRKWPWYFYLSPNATPWASTFSIGPGVSNKEKQLAKIRGRWLGHNYYVDDVYDFILELRNDYRAYIYDD